MNKQSHKRGLVAFSLVLIILLSAFACKKPEGGQAAESITAKTNSKFEPETDVNNRYVLAGYLMVELDNMYIWKPSDSECSLRYYDKQTGESDVLCAKPECLHDANGGNRECGGYAAPGSGGGLSYYKGKLYWLESDSSAGEKT